MKGLQHGINYGIIRFVVGGLGIGFDRDAYRITLSIDEGIQLGFQIYLLTFVVLEILMILWRE